MGSVAGSPVAWPRWSSGSWSWSVLAGLAVVVASQPTSGCQVEGTTLDPALQADVLLRDVGPHVVLPALDRLDEALLALDGAVTAWADEGEPALDDARVAYEDAMVVWQELEVMQVGPAAPSLSDPAGQDLRDEIYSWPTVNPCRVDQETIELGWAETDFRRTRLVNVYGLDALTHLLFAGPDDACPSQVGIDAAWAELDAPALGALRAGYAEVVVDGLIEATAELREHWNPAAGDFSSQLAAGDASPYGSELRALNAVYDAMFYLEAVTKDRKLAEPLGLGTCAADCSGLAESDDPYRSAAWVAANLRGFRAVFTGGAGRGFDDLLIEAGHADLAGRMLANLDEAIAVASAEHKPLDASMHDAVKRVTDDLKGDMATVLTLRLPLAAAGDND